MNALLAALTVALAAAVALALPGGAAALLLCAPLALLAGLLLSQGAGEQRERRQAAVDAVRGRRLYTRWKSGQGQEFERIAEDIAGRIDF